MQIEFETIIDASGRAAGPLNFCEISEAGERHGYAVTPDDDVSARPAEVRDICANHWTEDVIARWAAWKAANASPPEVPDRWEVRKMLVVERLIAAGKAGPLRALLDGLPDALRLRWDTATMIASDDADVRAAITALSEDPDEILAIE